MQDTTGNHTATTAGLAKENVKSGNRTRVTATTMQDTNHCTRTSRQKEPKEVSSPGIEPGSLQPQCRILTTVQTRPFVVAIIKIHKDAFFGLIP